jgi:hypothetical protein
MPWRECCKIDNPSLSFTTLSIWWLRVGITLERLKLGQRQQNRHTQLSARTSR